MIVERYDPVNLFEFVPKLQADFEPELRELDRLLEDDARVSRHMIEKTGRLRHVVLFHSVGASHHAQWTVRSELPVRRHDMACA